jgi:mannose-1-phosphate guanylyltransferase
MQIIIVWLILGKFIKAHQERPPDCLVTMMIFETSTPQSCGIVKLDDNMRVIEFHEKVNNPPSNLANGAVYILSHELITLFKTTFKGMTDFSNEIIPHLMGRIYTYKTDDVFMDIGTPQSYAEANRVALSKVFY